MELNGEMVKVKTEPEDYGRTEDTNTSLFFCNVPIKTEETPSFDNPEFLNCLNLRQEFEEDTETDATNTNVDNSLVNNNDSVEETPDIKPESTDSDHGSNSDDDDAIVCKVCKLRFLDDEDLQLHHKSRRIADRRYKCCKCDKMFRDNTQLIVHTRKHTGEKPFSCKVCNKKFSVNGNLSKHMRIHTGERKYECDTCERRFTQFAHLEDHMKIHSGDRPYKCEICETGFKTKARMKKHVQTHVSPPKLSSRSAICPLCSKILKNARQLMAHMETHEDSSGAVFTCKVCGKSYKNVFALNHHMRVHGEKVYKCTICDKAFTSASHLRRHLNSHTGVRPYLCEICMRPFPSQQNMKRHMMTHTGEKPYSCDECQRGFLTVENLNRHKRIHTGEKPFPCNICGKWFAHSTTAKEHMRVHTGDKPFACTKCNKRFAVNKALYRHTREKHPEYFPEFKEFNDLPPNVKRARAKMKIEYILDEQETYPNAEVRYKIEEHLNNSMKAVEPQPDDVIIKTETNINEEDYDVKPDVNSLNVTATELGVVQTNDLVQVKLEPSADIKKEDYS